jgi:single-strand DNA-binding protein
MRTKGKRIFPIKKERKRAPLVCFGLQEKAQNRRRDIARKQQSLPGNILTQSRHLLWRANITRENKMAGSLNKVMLIGNVGRDPEARSFQSGDRVVSFSMATEESWRDKHSGEKRSRTEWHQVQIYNENLGKIAEQYIRKGSKVFVSGQIQTRTYTDKDGAERKAFDIVLPKFGGEIVLLSKKDEDDSGGYDRGAERKDPPKKREPDPIDDDIPF